MCTVSFIPTGEKVVITSNRDEHINRPPAIVPQNYYINGKNIVFPKDPQGGGTWFAVQKDKAVLVLLNGADAWHQSQPPYRLSRGQIVLQLASSNEPQSMWDRIGLDNIESFTIVLFTDNKLFQLRWNGTGKSKIQLDEKQCHIWSSATLYKPEVIRMREDWFGEFIKDDMQDEEKILNFHQFTQSDDKENGLVINRNDQLVTHAVCQAVCIRNHIRITYKDLQKHKISHYHVHAI